MKPGIKFTIVFIIPFILSISGCKSCKIIGIFDACYDKYTPCYPIGDFPGTYEGRVSVNYPGPYYWGDRIVIEIDNIEIGSDKCPKGWSLEDQVNGKFIIYAKDDEGQLKSVIVYTISGYGSEHSYTSNAPSITSFEFDILDQFKRKILFGSGRLTRSTAWPYQIDLKITDMYLSGDTKKPYFTEIQVIKKK